MHGLPGTLGNSASAAELTAGLTRGLLGCWAVGEGPSVGGGVGGNDVTVLVLGHRLLERHGVRTQALLPALHQAAQRGHQVVQRHPECDGHQGPDRHAHPAADPGHQGKGPPSLPGCVTVARRHPPISWNIKMSVKLHFYYIIRTNLQLIFFWKIVAFRNLNTST